MKNLPIANISIVTLGVENLSVSTQFYEKLGWVNTTASQDSVSFLQGNSIVLGLYNRADLAKDAGVVDEAAGFRGVSLAINLQDQTKVDEFFSHAVACGAKAVKIPQKVFWGGYSGYFSDPDDHLWEVAFNPFFKGNVENGQLKLEQKQ
ncbi:MAG: VOC family protein [Rhizobiaceae bacterium]